jgi:hypothetical protein
MLKKAKAKPRGKPKAATIKKAAMNHVLIREPSPSPAVHRTSPGISTSKPTKSSHQITKKAAPSLRRFLSPEAQAPAVAPVAAALRAFNRVTEALGIVTEDKLKLLNLRKTKYFDCLKLNDPDLDLDTKDRLGYFLVIVELAGNLVGDAGDWLRSTNTAPLFGGKPPMELLLAGRMEGLFHTLNYLKSSYGGWA